jgi:hypothetical protein
MSSIKHFLLGLSRLHTASQKVSAAIFVFVHLYISFTF